MAQNIWFNKETGEVRCVEHAGNYLGLAIAVEPRETWHSTPLGTWEFVTDEERNAYREDTGEEITCEYC